MIWCEIWYNDGVKWWYNDGVKWCEIISDMMSYDWNDVIIM